MIVGDADGLTLGFAGGLFDADTGLTRFGARDYDPEVGRWTAKDPRRYPEAGTNSYVYAFSNPVLYMDPDGELPLIAGFFIGAGIDLAVQLAQWWAAGVRRLVQRPRFWSLRSRIGRCGSGDQGAQRSEVHQAGDWRDRWSGDRRRQSGRQGVR